jgi:site-specific DNA recombinase
LAFSGITKVAKYRGGIPFTYGPLAYLLKNRIYIGEMHYGGKWFEGEHEAILDRQTFERVQDLLESNNNGPRRTSIKSCAILQGKLYDDKGNLMGPSFSTKNGVRYRFYVSSALLRGRKDKAGSVGRVSAVEIETAVRTAVKEHQPPKEAESTPALRIETLERVVVSHDRLLITISGPRDRDNREIRAAWTAKPVHVSTTTEGSGGLEGTHNDGLIQSISRAHAWLRCLREGTYKSVEELAEANHIHPKVVRQALRLAFLSPSVTSAILEGTQPVGLALARIPKLLSLAWSDHRQLLT